MDKPKEYHECTECRCFVWCESPKQWYHKVSKTPCDDFEPEEGAANG